MLYNIPGQLSYMSIIIFYVISHDIQLFMMTEHDLINYNWYWRYKWNWWKVDLKYTIANANKKIYSLPGRYERNE